MFKIKIKIKKNKKAKKLPNRKSDRKKWQKLYC